MYVTKYVPGTEENLKRKGNRLILQRVCANCGILKNGFIKHSFFGSNGKRGGLLDAHAFIGKFPKPKDGFTLPNH